jgi:hypothetical protein
MPGVHQVKLLQQLAGTSPRRFAIHPVQAAHHREVLDPGQVFVNGGVLAREADALP